MRNNNSHRDEEDTKPASFQRLETFTRAILAVPKEEANKVEQEEKRKTRKRSAAPKPAK